MLEDGQEGTVQPEPVSGQEPVSTDGETSQDGETPKPADDAAKTAEAKMTEMVNKAVEEAVKHATEAGRREIQSAKDKARQEIEHVWW